MPALLPILLAGAHLLLVADRVPDFKVETSCRAAVSAAVANRAESACEHDERAARAKLENDWSQFTPAQRAHCVRLSRLGGLPSYVELLTCLEISKEAGKLPGTGPADGR
jgi:hypothetical protein